MADKKRKTLSVAVFIALTSNHLSAAEFDVRGLSKPLQRNVEYHLQPLAMLSVENLSRKRLSKLIDNALNPYGFYHPQFRITRQQSDVVRLDVEAGEVTTIARSDIVIVGDAQHDSSFTQLLDQHQLRQGQPLSHPEYEKLKRRLMSLAQRKGFIDARFTQSSLEVIPSRNIANVRLHFDSGQRYQFGELRIRESAIDSERIQSLSPFEQGDDFNSQQLSQFAMDLASTNWFGRVAVHGAFDDIEHGSEVPVDVVVDSSSRNIVQVGAGYTSDLGLRASLNWTKPWYNSRGHSFEARTYVSEPEQSLLLGYKIPTSNVLTDYYGVQLESKHIDYRDTVSWVHDLSLDKHWQLDNDWQSTMHVRFLREDYQQASETNRSQLLMPGITFTYLSRKHDLHEVKHRHVYSVEYSEPYLLSDSRLLHMAGESMLSWDISPSQKLHFRSSVGANLAQSLTDIPSSLRFFAGGEGNLRGYGYESISPTDTNGELTGARYLFTSGLEYQHQLHQQFWVGAFVDVGDAFNDKVDWKSGTGLSLIWNSKYVPLKLDLAYGLDAPQSDRFHVHFSLGTQF